MLLMESSYPNTVPSTVSCQKKPGADASGAGTAFVPTHKSENHLLLDWLSEKRRSILNRWTVASREFPRLAELQPAHLREMLENDLQGLTSFMVHDDWGVEDATRAHKVQAEGVLRDIPLKEQLSYLDRRVEICQELLQYDAHARHLQKEFIRRMHESCRFYKTVVRSIDIELRFASLT